MIFSLLATLTNVNQYIMCEDAVNGKLVNKRRIMLCHKQSYICR